MDIEEQPYRTGTADKSESQGERTILWFSVKTGILIALVVFIVVIVQIKNHYTVELVSSGNLPCEPFIKKSEDTIFVTSVSLINSKRAPISIQQISVQDVDANTVLSPAIYVVDLEDDALLESAGYTTQSEFRKMYSDRVNPLKYAPNGYLSEENQEFRSKSICIFLLFEDFPPPQHRVAVTCKCELYNTPITSYTLLRRD